MNQFQDNQDRIEEIKQELIELFNNHPTPGSLKNMLTRRLGEAYQMGLYLGWKEGKLKGAYEEQERLKRK